VTNSDCLRGVQTKLSKYLLYPPDKIDGVPGPRTDAAWLALQASFTAFSPATGKMSTFGGPNDSGVSPSEGLWCFPDEDISGFEHLFLPSQPSGTTGLARRLNPQAPYIACRWFDSTSVPFATKKAIRLLRYVVSARGKSVICTPADWGPSKSTGRICDLSSGVATALSVDTDDVVSVQLA
jgi:hypothetical protein